MKRLTKLNSKLKNKGHKIPAEVNSFIRLICLLTSYFSTNSQDQTSIVKNGQGLFCRSCANCHTWASPIANPIGWSPKRSCNGLSKLLIQLIWTFYHDLRIFLYKNDLIVMIKFIMDILIGQEWGDMSWKGDLLVKGWITQIDGWDRWKWHWKDEKYGRIKTIAGMNFRSSFKVANVQQSQRKGSFRYVLLHLLGTYFHRIYFHHIEQPLLYR
jgi:hypothetical protein